MSCCAERFGTSYGELGGRIVSLAAQRQRLTEAAESLLDLDLVPDF